MRFSVHDGPGIRTAVFFKGCPLSCWWCHNPESQKFAPDVMYSVERCRLCGECLPACPHGAIERLGDRMTVTDDCVRCGTCVDFCGAEARSVSGREMTAGEILAEIERDVVFFDESGGGVTFTGGEPFGQPELLEALLTECHARRIHTAIETCGAAPRQQVLRVGGLADRTYTGAGNRNILENLEGLVAAGRRVMVRMPIVPGVNDRTEDVSAACEYLAPLGIHRVELLAYHRTGTEKYRRLGRDYLLENTPPGAEAVVAVAKLMRAAGIAVKETL
jgi:pyruvate formate lyase activating enzyme